MALTTFTSGQILTAAQMNAVQANDYNQTVSTKTASYTLVAADKGTRVVMNSASATTITVNTSLFSAGDTLILQNISTGVCTVTAGTATVSTAGSLAIPQNGSGVLYFTSAGVSIFYPSAGAATTPGLVCVKAETSFSAVSSFSFDSVFTSTYTNYLMTIIYTSSTTANIDIKMRVGGVAASTNYNRNRGYFQSSVAGSEQDTAQTQGRLLVHSASGQGAGTIQIFQPFVAVATVITSQHSASAALYNEIANITHTTATAYDGMQFTPSSGTITGSYAIYGYSKAV